MAARRLAPKGGQTEFASTRSAYESLSAAEKAEIMKSYGLTVAASASELGSAIAEVLRRTAGPQ